MILGLWELWEEGFRENIGSEHPRERKSGNEEVIWDGGRYPHPVLCLGIGMGWKTEPCLAQAEIPPCSPSIPAGNRNLPLILQDAPLGSCLSSRKIRGEFSVSSAHSHPSPVAVLGSGHWAGLSKASPFLGSSQPSFLKGLSPSQLPQTFGRQRNPPAWGDPCSEPSFHQISRRFALSGSHQAANP